VVCERRKAELVGFGLDNKDGRLRVTHGKNFHLFGGSHETHQAMQEKCIKFNEKLDAKSKQLEDLEHKEFLEMAAECQMNVMKGRRKKRKL